MVRRERACERHRLTCHESWKSTGGQARASRGPERSERRRDPRIGIGDAGQNSVKLRAQKVMIITERIQQLHFEAVRGVAARHKPAATPAGSGRARAAAMAC